MLPVQKKRSNYYPPEKSFLFLVHFMFFVGSKWSKNSSAPELKKRASWKDSLSFNRGSLQPTIQNPLVGRPSKCLEVFPATLRYLRVFFWGGNKSIDCLAVQKKSAFQVPYRSNLEDHPSKYLGSPPFWSHKYRPLWTGGIGTNNPILWGRPSHW